MLKIHDSTSSLVKHISTKIFHQFVDVNIGVEEINCFRMCRVTDIKKKLVGEH